MIDKAREIVTEALRDFKLSWRGLMITDIAYKLLAFALLSPAVTGLLYWLRSKTSFRVMADADIARFFLTTRIGVVTLLLGSTLIVTIAALEIACLLAIASAASSGKQMTARSALAFGARHAANVLRLALNMVGRFIAGLAPFAIAGGLVYMLLLRSYDINFYLSRKPTEFWIAAVIVGVLGAGLAALILWTIARWALAIPLVVFENVSPRRALAESGRRSLGHRRIVVLVLATWAVFALALARFAGWLPEFLGRLVAPRIGDSLAALLPLVAGLALLLGLLLLISGVVNIGLFSVLITRMYLSFGGPAGHEHSASLVSEAPARLSNRARVGVVGVAVLAALGLALLLFVATRTNRPVLIIAHRGASFGAPENTLAAFRLAGELKADFVEFDVQESVDGEVLVVHDADLMKLARDPRKIWDTEAAALRSLDIGSWFDAKFASERVATLAEALAACKGKSKVVVELKSYGHNDRLEERVVQIVEAAGMQDDCVFMSLDHGMMHKLKQLRPTWRCGFLIATARGDLTELKGDFLAVETRMATRRFVRRAHRAGQDVYVWTVNDPAWMLTLMSRGVDGLITDKPDLARQVIERREKMSDAQRFLTALLVRVGARTEVLEDATALRP